MDVVLKVARERSRARSALMVGEVPPVGSCAAIFVEGGLFLLWIMLCWCHKLRGTIEDRGTTGSCRKKAVVQGSKSIKKERKEKREGATKPPAVMQLPSQFLTPTHFLSHPDLRVESVSSLINGRDIQYVIRW